MEVESKTDSATDETTQYTFDVFGTLKQVVLPLKTINYKVDYQNRRIAKFNGSSPELYYHWSNNQVIGVSDALGVLTSRFVYGSKAHSPDYMIKAGVKYRIVTDYLGSPVQVINSTTGSIVQEIRYDEWGTILSDTNPGFQPFGFAGCLYDLDTKLCRFGARDYDSSIGRWLSKDPILFNGSDSNLYGYVFQDPINYIDPTGEAGIFGAAFGAAVELGFQAYSNYQSGKDIYDVDNYDWWDVGVSAAVGAIGPGLWQVGKTSLNSGRAISTLSKQLNSARTANKVGKLQSRIQAHKSSISNVFKTQAVFQGLKTLGQSANSCE